MAIIGNIPYFQTNPYLYTTFHFLGCQICFVSHHPSEKLSNDSERRRIHRDNSIGDGFQNSLLESLHGAGVFPRHLAEKKYDVAFFWSLFFVSKLQKNVIGPSENPKTWWSNNESWRFPKQLDHYDWRSATGNHHRKPPQETTGVSLKLVSCRTRPSAWCLDLLKGFLLVFFWEFIGFRFWLVVDLPLWNILVNGKDCPIYDGKKKTNHQTVDHVL